MSKWEERLDETSVSIKVGGLFAGMLFSAFGFLVGFFFGVMV